MIASGTGGVEVEEVKEQDLPFLSESGGIGSIDGREIYFMGIIDILTVYTMGKFFENRYKRARLQKGISAVSPRKYAERFKAFVSAGIKIINKAVSGGGVGSAANGQMNGVKKRD